jgi:hypothetical protein
MRMVRCSAIQLFSFAFHFFHGKEYYLCQLLSNYTDLFFRYWGVKCNWVHSALRPPIGLLCQPRVIMMMEKLVELLAGETEVLGENLPQCRSVHHKPHMSPGREPGPPPRWEASD